MFGKILRAAAIAAIFTGFICAANAQTRVACVGNSITEGYGIWDQKKYPDHLQEMLGDSYSVQNFGVSSMTFANKGPADNMSYWNTTKFKAALEFNPEIVVIELGTNDSKFFTNNCIENGQPTYNYNYGQYEKEQLYKDYEALLDTFMHLPANPKVYATLQPYSNNCGWGIMDTAIVNQINPIIQEVATRKGVEIIDLHSQFNTPEWFLADSVHPNATGAKELARIIKEGILKAPADTSNTPADTSKTPADTVPEVSDSTGTQDSTTAIRGNEFARDAGSSQERNARGFGGQDAHSFVNQDARGSKAYDMQGRYIPSRKQAASPTVKKGGTR
jgi:lysophospholipase L1-like esterase